MKTKKTFLSIVAVLLLFFSFNINVSAKEANWEDFSDDLEENKEALEEATTNMSEFITNIEKDYEIQGRCGYYFDYDDENYTFDTFVDVVAFADLVSPLGVVSKLYYGTMTFMGYLDEWGITNFGGDSDIGLEEAFKDFLPEEIKDKLQSTKLYVLFVKNKATDEINIFYVTTTYSDIIYCLVITDINGNLLDAQAGITLYDYYEEGRAVCGIYAEGLKPFIRSRKLLINFEKKKLISITNPEEKEINKTFPGLKAYIDSKTCSFSCPLLVYDEDISIKKWGVYTLDDQYKTGQRADDMKSAKEGIDLENHKFNLEKFPMHDYLKYDESLYKACDEYVVFKGEPIKCSDFYVDGENIFQTLFIILMIAGPIVFIIFNAIEIVKAVISSDEEKIRKMWSNLIKRVVALILLFLVPLIITIIMSVSGNAGIFNENVPEVCLDK